VAGLGEVDPDLVGAPGFQAALDEGGQRQGFDRPHVRDREPPQARVVGGAAESVPAVGDEPRAQGPGGDPAVRQREVAPLDVVHAELLLEMALAREVAGEHDEPGGVARRVVHDADLASGAAPAVTFQPARGRGWSRVPRSPSS
jgi:hypothetical protein